MPRLYFLYAATIFVSAFLLFQVQPLLGKHILPWFGGSPAVWITALFFFMGGLAVGYTYALLLTWLSRAWQVLIHSGVTVLVVATLYHNSQSWPSAITPGVADISSTGDPAWAVFYILAVSVGLPFMLLSSTSSLLQFWYGRATGNEPFSLYAISNAGSLLGLLSYPLWFERFLSTVAQGWWWAFGFSLYVALLIAVLLQYLQQTPRKQVSDMAEQGMSTMPSVRQFVVWLLLASIPIMTMVTGTDYLTGYVVAIPFLWVVPLALYLLSFVVSFRGGSRTPKVYTYLFTLIATLLAVAAISQNFIPVIPTVLLIFLAMFSVNHLCHEWLYALRPDKEHLTAFYVALAFGGIFASSVVLVASLYVVPIPVEFLFLIIGAASVSAVSLLIWHREYLERMHKLAVPWVVVSLIAVLISGYSIVAKHTSHVIATERNFFGFKAITEREISEHGVRRSLIHNVTNHGYQFLDPDLAHKPVGYYSDTSGVGVGFHYLRERYSNGLRVAVAGLGAGALAARCHEGDTFHFFEIDPQVVTLAKEYFTFLTHCQGHEIIVGDARLSKAALAQESEEPIYNYIILDAYADDSMPVHLMTNEAIAEYLELLTPDGLLAIHISSRYLRLLPVVHALAEANGMVAYHRHDVDHTDLDVSSHWAILARDEVVFDDTVAEMFHVDEPRPRLWTDRYSSLLPLVRWR